MLRPLLFSTDAAAPSPFFVNFYDPLLFFRVKTSAQHVAVSASSMRDSSCTTTGSAGLAKDRCAVCWRRTSPSSNSASLPAAPSASCCDPIERRQPNVARTRACRPRAFDSVISLLSTLDACVELTFKKLGCTTSAAVSHVPNVRACQEISFRLVIKLQASDGIRTLEKGSVAPGILPRRIASHTNGPAVVTCSWKP